ncbi:MAG TPA: efflux RND transporter periplasmic adaptor subunit [Roseimicrobium sp.]|nr:efflux RND transporter periplasmic adaptor subunit [Roseimicrobium sp.]
MNSKLVLLSFPILLIVAVATGLTGCSRSDDHAHPHDHGHGEGAHEEPSFEKGPHGGRMLRDGTFALELAIFEKGVPPEFHAYVTQDGKTVPPAGVALKVELRRLGGRVDNIAFKATGDLLRGESVVYEPHSFYVNVAATHAGKVHEWHYESYESRIDLGADLARASGLVVETAGPARIASRLELPGEVRLNPDRTAQVTARFGGVITEVRSAQGDAVKAGDVLAVIESRELAEARTEYIESVHKLELTQAVYKREEGLWRKKISAEQDFLVVKHELEEAEIRKQSARQKLLALGLSASELKDLAVEPAGEVVTFEVRKPFPEKSLTRYEVRAPLNGTVLTRDMTVGTHVPAGQPLFQIADLTTVWVEVAVPVEKLSGLETGLQVRVASKEQDIAAEGRLTYLSPLVQESSRTVPARITLANPDGRWRPGLFVRTEIVHSSAEVSVSVKESALQTFRDEQVVFINDGTLYEPVVVETGRRDGDHVEITSGLSAGMRYVSGNSFLIKAHILKSGATHDH